MDIRKKIICVVILFMFLSAVFLLNRYISRDIAGVEPAEVKLGNVQQKAQVLGREGFLSKSNNTSRMTEDISSDVIAGETEQGAAQKKAVVYEQPLDDVILVQ